MQLEDYSVREVFPLFHCTRQAALRTAICEEGLDLRMSNQGVFGKGEITHSDTAFLKAFSQESTLQMIQPNRLSTVCLYVCGGLLSNCWVWADAHQNRAMFCFSVLLGDCKHVNPGPFVKEPPKVDSEQRTARDR